MKKAIYLVAATILGSCSQPISEKKENTYRDSSAKEIFDGVSYQEVVIDSCEYIIGRDELPYNGGYFLTHKGNCHNPIHNK